MKTNKLTPLEKAALQAIIASAEHALKTGVIGTLTNGPFVKVKADGVFKGSDMLRFRVTAVNDCYTLPHERVVVEKMPLIDAMACVAMHLTPHATTTLVATLPKEKA